MTHGKTSESHLFRGVGFGYWLQYVKDWEAPRCTPPPAPHTHTHIEILVFFKQQSVMSAEIAAMVIILQKMTSMPSTKQLSSWYHTGFDLECVVESLLKMILKRTKSNIKRLCQCLSNKMKLFNLVYIHMSSCDWLSMNVSFTQWSSIRSKMSIWEKWAYR